MRDRHAKLELPLCCGVPILQALKWLRSHVTGDEIAKKCGDRVSSHFGRAMIGSEPDWNATAGTAKALYRRKDGQAGEI
ncbi:MAG: hypothetical protein KME42_17385 [Tildeniella nuda ZEHNDER 1965/U140]|nr:hypothetical protein [Tildeniella nuda ZEHNDER 1965/U140]